MILSDREIAAALDHKQIVIDPRPEPDKWTSTAIDLTLHVNLIRWKQPKARPTGAPPGPETVYPAKEGFNVTQMSGDADLADHFSIAKDGYALGPHEFILGFTSEKIYLPNQSRIAARVEGKSSLARVGVGVHVTAPTIHAGFGLNKNNPLASGMPIQLEIFNLGIFKVHLEAGMAICQLILEEVREVPTKGYAGRYADQGHFQG